VQNAAVGTMANLLAPAVHARNPNWTKEQRFEPRTREGIGREAERISGEHSYRDTSANKANQKTEKERLSEERIGAPSAPDAREKSSGAPRSPRNVTNHSLTPAPLRHTHFAAM